MSQQQKTQAQRFPWVAPQGYKLAHRPSTDVAQEVAVELMNGETLHGELISLDIQHACVWLRFSNETIRSLALSAIRSIRNQSTLFKPRRAIAELNLQKAHVQFADSTETTLEICEIQNSDHGLFIFLPRAGDPPVACFFPYQALASVTIDQDSYDLPLSAADFTLNIDDAIENELVSGSTHDKGAHPPSSSQPASNSDELICALHDARARPRQRLGELLLQRAQITQEQLDKALKAQGPMNDRRLGEILVASGAITDTVLLQTLADKLGIPFVDVRRFEIESNVLELIPSSVAKRYQVLPLVATGGELIVAVPNPLEFKFEQELQFILNSNVVAIFADPHDLSERIALEYEAGRSPRIPFPVSEQSLSDIKLEDITDRLAREAQRSTQNVVTEELGVSVSDNALVRFVNKIIIDAYEKRASDIHIESSKGSGSKIRMRIDGVLHDYLELQPIYRKALVSRIKVMSNLDISEHRHAQDGKINFARFSPIALQLRVAILPTTDDEEDVVLRLLGASEPIPMEKLQLGDEYLQIMQKMIHRSHGLILVCGPTGSGKTTTLHSVLREINSPERKIWTAEDPIEISQAGLRQVQINAHIGWTFAMAMRAFLRADPDVIMVGEMRDAETTNIGIEASLTGHLVFSTLHTNSAAESVVRLLEMGMDPFNFSDALIGILSQRLARTLCKQCKHKRILEDAEIQDLAAEYCAGTPLTADRVIENWQQTIWKSSAAHVFEPAGCSECDQGYHGRMGIYELLSASDEVKRLIRTQGSVPEIKAAAMDAGMKLLHQDALTKALQGHIDLAWARAVSS